MPTISITNVDVFDGLCVRCVSTQCFQGSPGNILAPQSNVDVCIDGTGCTVIPGLIDAKVDANASPDALPTFTSFGITTVIDSISTTTECQAMQQIAAQNPSLPSYLATGSAIGPESANFLGMFPYRAIQVATTPAAAQIVVAENVSVSDGGHFIKIIVDQPGLDSQTMAAAVAAAHQHGRLAIGQASQADSYKLALDAGFDIVTGVPVDRALCPEVVRGFAQNGIGVVPTLSYLRKAVHKAANTNYDFSHAMVAVKQLHEAGVRICAGSSANNEDGMTVSYGQSLHDELKLLAEAGLSNIEVIRAATCVPSTLFKLRDRGAIEPGYRADLILVDGNPLENLATINRIRRVWVAGVEIDIRKSDFFCKVFANGQ